MKGTWSGVLALALLVSFAIGWRAGADAPLADAAEHQNWTTVRTLLTQRADVNAPQADGMTALHWAVHHDNLEMADRLLRAGASVKAANRYGITPLSLACTNGSGAVVDLLLKAGADPNVPAPGGETPLMTASRTGALAVVKSLLTHGEGGRQGRSPRPDRVDVGGGRRPRRRRAGAH